MGTIGTKMRVERGNKEKEVKEGRQEEQGIHRENRNFQSAVDNLYFSYLF